MTESPTPSPSPSTLLRLARPGFLVITAVACLLGLASAASAGRGLDVLAAVATLSLALAMHAGANILNDYHDARNGADAANTTGLFPFTGGSRLIQQGEVSAGQAHRIAWVLLGVSVLGGLGLVWRAGPGLLGVGVAGLCLAWAYSAPPLQLMSRGLGETAVALSWGLIVVGADQVQRHTFAGLPVALALSYALLVANILLINGFPDAPADRQVGKHSLVVRLGADRAAQAYAGIAVLAHAWLGVAVWAGLLAPGALWGLVSLPLALSGAAGLWRQRQQAGGLRPAIVQTIGAAVLHGLALAAGLAWG